MSKDQFKNDSKPKKRGFDYKLFLLYPALFSILLGLGSYFNGEGHEDIAVGIIFGYPTFFLGWILYRMVFGVTKVGIKSTVETIAELKELTPLVDDIKSQLGIDLKQRQEKFFETQTIPELKNYIQSKGYSGKIPSIKADFVNVALRLWIIEQQLENGK